MLFFPMGRSLVAGTRRVPDRYEPHCNCRHKKRNLFNRFNRQTAKIVCCENRQIR